MHLIRTAAIALAALLSLAVGQASAKPHPNWTVTVATGEGGSHVLGNPDAKVKLTEYISYTCPHCAHFHKESDAALKLGYVLRGTVSVEIRHLVRDKVDLVAALLAGCGDPKQFFGNHNMFLQTQDKWIEIMGTASDGQKARWNAGKFADQFKAIARDFGFYAMMEQRGYRRNVLDQCLSDEAKARLLTTETQNAINGGVEGTPSFKLNGTLIDAHDWEGLDAELKTRI